MLANGDLPSYEPSWQRLCRTVLYRAFACAKFMCLSLQSALNMLAGFSLTILAVGTLDSSSAQTIIFRAQQPLT